MSKKLKPPSKWMVIGRDGNKMVMRGGFDTPEDARRWANINHPRVALDVIPDRKMKFDGAFVIDESEFTDE